MKILYIYTILFFVCLNWINCVVIPCYFRKIDECKGLFFFQQIVLYYSVLKKHWKLFHQITFWIGNLMKYPINIRSKTPLVSTLTRATMATRRAYIIGYILGHYYFWLMLLFRQIIHIAENIITFLFIHF